MLIWIKKMKNLFSRSPFFTAKVMLDKIPGRPFQIEKLFVLILSKPSNLGIKRLEIREGDPRDIQQMCVLENKEPDLFGKRFDDGIFCAVATNEDKTIVGYQWFSNKAVHLEELLGYRLEIPRDSVYAYDAFIKVEYRRRGIWVNFQNYMLDKAKRLGREKVVAMVSLGNEVFLKAHLHKGYVITKNIICIRLFSKWFFRQKMLAPADVNTQKTMGMRQ